MIIEPKEFHSKALKTIEPVDFAIIGSGSAGSVLAYHLSRAGYKVVVLEKGAYYPTEELQHREVGMYSKLMNPNTFDPTVGQHTRVAILQGQCYGGSTVSCDGVSWDLPRAVREDWEALGLKSFSPKNSKIDDYFKELRKDMNIHQVPEAHHNRNNQLLKIACDMAGLECRALDRNVLACMRCGYCAQGCKYGLKMDAPHTYLKWAQEYHCDIYTGAEVYKIKINYTEESDLENKRKLDSLSPSSKDDLLRRLKKEKESAKGIKFKVEAKVRDNKFSGKPRGYEPPESSLTVPAHNVIVSAGTIASSRLLLKSGINPNNCVGKKFSLHPTAFIHALHPKLTIKAFNGINNSYECTHFAYEKRNEDYYDPEHHGFFLEASFSLPWGIANILPFYGERHLQLMKNVIHIQGVQLNVKSDAYGEVKEDEVRYDISELDNQKLVFGTKLVAKLMLMLGAKEIYAGTSEKVIKSKDDIDPVIDNFIKGKKRGYMTKQALLHTGHPFGGNIMGADPNSSVVNENCESHHYKGLFVCDGSVFPTTIGVNPHLSISMVARKTADHILESKNKENGR